MEASFNAVLHLVAMVSVAASSAFYTYVWFRPERYTKFVAPSDPCKTMAFWANILKVIQIASISLATDWAAAFNLSWMTWALIGALLFFGQHLNFLVFKLLGRDGVYYGSRFGKKLPWIYDYPYSHIKDPQYVGSIVTLLGCAFVIPTELFVWWLANYLYLMWLESEVPAATAAGN